MQETIYATFADPNDAEKAAGALLDNGVREEDLTIVQSHDGMAEPIAERWRVQPEFGDDVDTRVTDMPGSINGGITGMPLSTPSYAASPNEPAYTMAVNAAVDGQPTEIDSDVAAKQGITVTTAGDAGIGAAKGAGWGLGVGAVAALASLFIPGAGLVIGGGALATAIGAAAATTGAGALAGAVTGYLKDQGFEEKDGVLYGEVLQAGGAVLSVSLPSGHIDVAKAWDILDKYHGSPLSQTQRARTSYLA